MKNTFSLSRMGAALLGTLCLVSAGAAFAQSTLSGLQPDRRPVNAPTLKEHTLSPEQLKGYLHGVTDPVPANVQDVAQTGNWFVPLRKPGMTGPYDIRNWHARSKSDAAAK